MAAHKLLTHWAFDVFDRMTALKSVFVDSVEMLGDLSQKH
jgi:hypothetical protein